MGLSIFKPKQIEIVFVENDSHENDQVNNKIENTEINNKSENTEVNSKLETIIDTAKNTKKILDEITKKFLIIDINQSSSLLLENGITPRTLGASNNSSTITADDNEFRWIDRYPNFDLEINFFTEIYSMDELEQYLSECSSPEQLSSSNDSPEEKPFPESEDEICQGDDNEFNALTKSALQSLFDEEKLLMLSKQPENALILKTLLEKASKAEILSDVIDKVIDNGNTAISVAILHGNVEALSYLIRYRAHIPYFIFTEGRKVTFLNYLASNAKISLNQSGNGYILTKILYILINDYKLEDVESYLCEIDPNSGLSFPHLLLILYQNSNDFRFEITQCLKLCFEACPNSIKVLCTSIYCGGYKFNVIAHSIILPVTNFEIIEYFMKIGHSEEDLSMYESLIQVHQNQETRITLSQIIKRN